MKRNFPARQSVYAIMSMRKDNAAMFSRAKRLANYLAMWLALGVLLQLAGCTGELSAIIRRTIQSLEPLL